MIRIDKLWSSFIGNANIEQGGWVRPAGNFINWVNDISNEIFEDEFGSDYEVSQRSSDTLAQPFLVTANVIIDAVGGRNFGVAKYPPDYGHYSSTRVLIRDGKVCGCKGVPTWNPKTGVYVDPDAAAQRQRDFSDYEEIPIAKVDNQRWGSATTHKIRKPTERKPIITQFDGGFKVAPGSIGVLVLDYLKKPVPAVFNYTIDPNTDEVIFVDAGSVHLEWPEMIINKFLSRLMKRYGAYTRETMMVEFGEGERKIT